MPRITLTDTLYEMIERINDDELSDEELERVVKKSRTINELAKTINEQDKIKLDTLKFLDDRGYSIEGNLKQIGYEEKTI